MWTTWRVRVNNKKSYKNGGEKELDSCGRLCQSALDLSLPAGSVSMVTIGGSAPLTAEDGAERNQAGAKPKSHAYLTPPLPRKKHRIPETVIAAQKSHGFIKFLKARFDRAGRAGKSGSCSSASQRSEAQDLSSHEAVAWQTSSFVPSEENQDFVSLAGSFTSSELSEESGRSGAGSLTNSPQLSHRSLVRKDSNQHGVSSGTCVMPRFGKKVSPLVNFASSGPTLNTEQHVSSAEGHHLVGSSDKDTIRPAAMWNGPYRLHVLLKQARDLVAMDTCGTSDPYVKFKLGNKVVYKSKVIYRDLHPVWDESFTVTLNDLEIPVHVRLFDYDWALQDDFLGEAVLELHTLELHKPKDFTLDLHFPDSDAYHGSVDLRVTLSPKTLEEEPHDTKASRSSDQTKRLKSQIWSSVVNITLIEGKFLCGRDGESPVKPYIRFKLGNEKYKSKSVTWSCAASTATWLEQFDFHLFDDQSHLLEVNLCDKEQRGRDDSIAKSVIDLNNVEREKTQSVCVEFQDVGSGSIHLLITISGTTASETISDLAMWQPSTREIENIHNRYKFLRSLHNIRDVGYLTVKVYRATGLAAADLGGKSDPFCVLELGNSRLQTQTEYKTLNPNWNKIFTFNIKDINAVLEVTVYDEDRDHRVEFLGKIAVPLLRIRQGQRRWYALKDRKLRTRAKGNNPQILLEMSVVWSPVRASVQTLQPKEKKYMEVEAKFNRRTFVRNVMRVKAIVVSIIDFGLFIESCWEWESPFKSSLALILFVLITWNFEPYMLPAAFLLLFFRNLLLNSLSSSSQNEDESDVSADDEDEDVDDKSKEERKSLKERLQAIHEVTQTVQNSIGYIASVCESVKNTFNISVPFLSYLAMFLLVIATILLYYIPVRYLILLWGVNKFTRKLLRPHSINNNELLDFLSRVPDDEQITDYREFRLQPSTHQDKYSKRSHRKK